MMMTVLGELVVLVALGLLWPLRWIWAFPLAVTFVWWLT
jgi:hypothetical protein